MSDEQMTNETIEELIRAYDEYIALLVRSEEMMMGLALAHGFHFPPSMVKRGAELREQITRLKSQLRPILSDEQMTKRQQALVRSLLTRVETSGPYVLSDMDMEEWAAVKTALREALRPYSLAHQNFSAGQY